MNYLISFWQSLVYGALNRRPAIDFSEIPAQIQFTSHYDEKNEVYWVEAENLPEFIVTGKTKADLARNIGDTLMVYFDIPTYFAKKFVDGSFQITDPKTGVIETIQVNKEELNKVLA